MLAPSARARLVSASVAAGWILVGACSATTVAGKAAPPVDAGAETSDQQGAPVCSFPPAATPSDDSSTYGCQGIFPAPSCPKAQFEVYCVGPFDGGAEAGTPAPAASAACTLSPQATLPNALYWCCPCGP
jgi:hypothetical protein